jgi:hypothetical protein
MDTDKQRTNQPLEEKWAESPVGKSEQLQYSCPAYPSLHPCQSVYGFVSIRVHPCDFPSLDPCPSVYRSVSIRVHPCLLFFKSHSLPEKQKRPWVGTHGLVFSIRDACHGDGFEKAVGPRTWAPRPSKRPSNRSSKLRSTRRLRILLNPSIHTYFSKNPAPLAVAAGDIDAL